MISNALDAIKFRKDFCYAKAAPSFVSNNTGVSDEIARWVLDRNALLYRDKRHAPRLYRSKVNRLSGEKGDNNTPVLAMTDALIYTTDSIILFWEQRCLPQNRLLPDEAAAKDEVLDLYHLFTGPFFADKVNKFMYQRLLSYKKGAKKVFKAGVPLLEKLMITVGFPFIKRGINHQYNLPANTSQDNLIEIRKMFDRVDAMLSDGRRYLAGDRFTLADLAFAAAAAPVILPVEFGGALPDISQVPDDYREAVYQLRATTAGQFVLRIYQEERPVMLPQSDLPKEPGLMGKLLSRLLIALGKKKYKLFCFLQRNFPVLKLPLLKLAVINQNDLLKEALNRDLDFTIEEINSKRMSDQKGAFFLGMDRNNPQYQRESKFMYSITNFLGADRNNPQYERESKFMQGVAKREDLEIIQQFVRAASGELIAHSLQYGKIDVANSYCKVILVRLIDYYFGVPSPTETEMKRWLRDLFFDLFLNLTSNKTKHRKALIAGNERKEWLLKILAERKQALKDGKTLADNLFNRMIILSQQKGYEWVDDDVLQRNIGGLITGIFETSNKAVILTLDELFKRKDTLKEAVAVAHTGDTKRVYGYVSEALRFNPVQPGVIRYCESSHLLSGKGTKMYTIPAKTKVLALTAGAMFDPAVFPDPEKFISDRPPAEYMNYGFALHECYGKYINSVTLAEFTSAILRLPNVRREAGRTGRGTGINIESFPNNFVVAFDAPVKTFIQ